MFPQNQMSLYQIELATNSYVSDQHQLSATYSHMNVSCFDLYNLSDYQQYDFCCTSTPLFAQSSRNDQLYTIPVFYTPPPSFPAHIQLSSQTPNLKTSLSLSTEKKQTSKIKTSYDNLNSNAKLSYEIYSNVVNHPYTKQEPIKTLKVPIKQAKAQNESCSHVSKNGKASVVKNLFTEKDDWMQNYNTLLHDNFKHDPNGCRQCSTKSYGMFSVDLDFIASPKTDLKFSSGVKGVMESIVTNLNKEVVLLNINIKLNPLEKSLNKNGEKREMKIQEKEDEDNYLHRKALNDEDFLDLIPMYINCELFYNEKEAEELKNTIIHNHLEDVAFPTVQSYRTSDNTVYTSINYKNPLHQYAYCAFCRSAGEPLYIYISHPLVDYQTHVVCPMLQAKSCKICRATGKNACMH